MSVSKVKRVGTSEKMMKIVKKGDKKVYLIAQELNLVRALADNNKSSRDKAIKKLKAWFANRTETMPFTEGDLQRIWKGLFYSMWMSDKPLIQEECAENISNLVHFNTLDSSLLFFKAGLTILMNEWFGIDQLRLDKFYMLVRRLLRQILFVLKKHSFNKKNIAFFNNILSETILRTTTPPPLGLFMHFTEIFMEELAKVSKGHIDSNRVVDMLQPFLEKMISTNDRREIGHIRKFIFTYLIRQSDLGLEYQAKYDAWKQQGFPGNIDSMQKVKLDNDDQMSADEDDNEDINDKPLDPRAGRVNVELPQIKFNSGYLASVLLKYKFHESSTTTSRKMITTLIEQFSKLSKGIYPLGIKTIEIKRKNNDDVNIRKATNRLIKFEKKIMGKKRKRKPDKENKEEPEKKRLKVDNALISKKGKHAVVLQNEKVLIENNKTKKKRKKSSINNLETETNIPNIDSENSVQHNGANQDQNKKITRSSTSGHIKKKRNKLIKSNEHRMIKSKRNKPIVNNIECVFERNSGTWVVYDISRIDKNEIVPSAKTEVNDVMIQEVENPSKSSEHLNKLTRSNKLDKNRIKTKVNVDKEICSEKKLASDKSMGPIGSPKSGLSPVKLFESSPDRKELFFKSEWDEPLQEGEYEICIPSKKYVGQLKKLATKNDSTVQTIINNTMKKIKGKSNSSLNSSMTSNSLSTPNGTKKVKINTKLNRSQEVHEHHAQILSSPAIPYDANKKPSKPLLKAPFKLTPINPFYRKQLSCFW